MLRSVAASVAAIVVSGALSLPQPARAEPPFETVPMPATVKAPHRAAYVCLLGGIGLMGASFALANRADDAYTEYLASLDPSEIERLYDEATHYDKLASAALISGEVLVATGIYLRFLRHPKARLELSAAPSRCAVSYRF